MALGDVAPMTHTCNAQDAPWLGGCDPLAHLEEEGRAERKAKREARKTPAAKVKRRAERKQRKANRHRDFLAAAKKHYPQLVAENGGEHCAICEAKRKQRRLNIDHDHERMVIRGLLCHRCNRVLHSWVTAAWLRAAAAYLEKAHGRGVA